MRAILPIKIIFLLMISTASFAQMRFKNFTTASLVFYNYESTANRNLCYQTTFGIKFSPHLYSGLGIGYDVYSGYGYKSTFAEKYLPVFINIRYFILKGNNSPYFSFSGGYGINIFSSGQDEWGEYTGGLEGGYMINPSIGLMLHISGCLDYIFEVGYKNQGANNYSVFDGLTIGTGLSF